MINFLNLKKIDFKWEEDFPTFLWNSYTAKTLEMFKINARSMRFMSEGNVKANCDIMLKSIFYKNILKKLRTQKICKDSPRYF